MSDILKRHATENFFDRTWDRFEDRLERGQFAHTAFPGWLLIRSACTDCDADVTVIKYKGRRIQLVPTGDNQMGKHWIIHQCPETCHTCDAPLGFDQDEHADGDALADQWKDSLDDEYGEAEDIAEAQAEAKGEIYPDDPNVRDGNGDIVAHFDWGDES